MEKYCNSCFSNLNDYEENQDCPICEEVEVCECCACECEECYRLVCDNCIKEKDNKKLCLRCYFITKWIEMMMLGTLSIKKTRIIKSNK